jgi:hypothetical protein
MRRGLAVLSLKLAKGEKVAVECVFDEPEASPKAPAVPRSFANNSPGFFVIPSESQGHLAKDKSEYSRQDGP